MTETLAPLEHTSKTVEDYLLSVYTMSSEGRSVIAARLAEELHGIVAAARPEEPEEPFASLFRRLPARHDLPRARRFYERNGWVLEQVKSEPQPLFGGAPTEVALYRKSLD